MEQIFVNLLQLREKYEDYERARDFARKAHEGQIRKATKEPYVNHPITVQKILEAYNAPDWVVEASVLHDTLEDTETSYEKLEKEFGKKIANLIEEVSNTSMVKILGKEDYMNEKMCDLSKPALGLKLADIIHNTIDKPKIDQKERMRKNVIFLIRNRRNMPREGWVKELLLTACDYLNIDYQKELDIRRSGSDSVKIFEDQ